jgi:dTDP-4-dehydrorhamnose reductase
LGIEPDRRIDLPWTAFGRNPWLEKSRWDTMLKILLIGKNGQLGWELRGMLAPLGQIIAYGRDLLDVTSNDQISQRIREVRPNVIVNAAAYTAVDRAEIDSENATQVNAIAPGVMAEEAKRIGATMVHYSTDYVFDGTQNTPYVEQDRPNPLNVYGSTKLGGELAIQAVGSKYLIFRTSWVYSNRGSNFLLKILQLAKGCNELKIVDDQFGAPTWSRTIARVTAVALERCPLRDASQSGLFHLSAGGITTWYQFAKEAVAQMGLAATVVPISSAQYGARARRPSSSALCTNKLVATFNVDLPFWEVSMRDVLHEHKKIEGVPVGQPQSTVS